MIKQVFCAAALACALSVLYIPAFAGQELVADGVDMPELSFAGNSIGEFGEQNGDDPLLDPSGNTISIINGSKTYIVMGGWIFPYFMTQPASSADNNSVLVDNSETADVNGAYVEASDGNATANGNRVEIRNNSYVDGNIFGGEVIQTGGSASADGNTVVVTGSHIRGGIIGGLVDTPDEESGSASHNAITLTDVRISGNRYIVGGVVATSGVAAYNTITIAGAANSMNNVTIIGGTGYSGNIDTGGNTLNIKSPALSVKGVSNFANINFYLSPGVSAGQTILSVTNPMDITGVKIGVGLEGGEPALAPGDTIRLIGNDGGLTSDQDGTRVQAIAGIATIYQFDLSADATGLYATIPEEPGGGGGKPGDGDTDGKDVIKLNPQLKALSEGRESGIAFLGQAADLVASQGITNALRAAAGREGGGSAVFSAIGAGKSKYKTGSHVDVKGFSVMAGLTKQLSGAITGAAFVEGGWGNYDSFNSFNGAASVNGSGNNNYYGLGLLGRYGFDGPWYSEASLRLGRTEADFSSNDILNSSAGTTSYESPALYAGFHAAVGYEHKINEKLGIDLAGKFFYTYQDGDDVNISGDDIKFDAANSIRARLGGRVNYTIKSTLTPYGSAYLDYEFDGKAKAWANGLPIDAPELKGLSALGELGLIFTPSRKLPLTLDIGLQGYAGKRQGISGSLLAKLLF